MSDLSRAQILQLYKMLVAIDLRVPQPRPFREGRRRALGHLFALAPSFVTQASGSVLAHPERFDAGERAAAERAAEHQARHNGLRGLEAALLALARRCGELALVEQVEAVRLCKEQARAAAGSPAKRRGLAAALRLLGPGQR